MIHRWSAFGEPTMVGTTWNWEDELGRWLKPFLLGSPASSQLCRSLINTSGHDFRKGHGWHTPHNRAFARFYAPDRSTGWISSNGWNVTGAIQPSTDGSTDTLAARWWIPLS